MKNITKRDIKVFLIGMLAMLLIEAVYDWDSTIRGFKDGYKSGSGLTK